MKVKTKVKVKAKTVKKEEIYTEAKTKTIVGSKKSSRDRRERKGGKKHNTTAYVSDFIHGKQIGGLLLLSIAQLASLLAVRSPHPQFPIL